MQVDISPIVQALVGTAAAVITVATPFVTVWINSHLKIKNDSLLAQRISTGVEAMGQIAIAEANSLGAHNPTVEIKNQAVASAVSQASAGMNTAMALTGITPDTIAKRVQGYLAANMPTPATEKSNAVAS